MMVLFAGIDLLGKFLAGRDDRGEAIERRFTKLIQAYLLPSSAHATHEAGLIWRVRNAVMHAVGLYDDGRGQGRHISVSSGPWTSERTLPIVAAVEAGDAGVWLVAAPRLYLGFIDAVAAYEADVRKRPELQQAFGAMYPRYGRVRVLSGR